MVNLDNARGLTLVNPWAYAVTNCGKRIENRSWAPRQVDTILIHAGAKLELGDAMATFNAAGFVLPPVAIARAVVAVAAIAGVCTRSRSSDRLVCDCGVWAAAGQIHWRLAEVTVLKEPVPCRGSLGLWTPPSEVLTAVKEQI